MSTLEELFQKIAAGRAPAPAGPVEYIIVGLGNPGRKMCIRDRLQLCRPQNRSFCE